MSGSAHTVADQAADTRRDPHTYAQDLFTYNILDNEEGPELGNAILLIDTEYLYTPQNTPLEEVKSHGPPRKIFGQPKGDIDFGIIDFEENLVIHREFKAAREVDENPEYERRYSGDEQVERFKQTVKLLNEHTESEWSFEGSEVYLDERSPALEDHPPSYSDGIWYGQDYQQLLEQEDFEAVDEVLFDGRLREKPRIRRE